jgi:hypothetical protein
MMMKKKNISKLIMLMYVVADWTQTMTLIGAIVG